MRQRSNEYPEPSPLNCVIRVATGNADAMTARQFLLSESTYCRQRAANCPDRFLAEELRRLAECFERTAEAAQVKTSKTEIAESQGSH